MIKLTKAQWAEIYYSLASKVKETRVTKDEEWYLEIKEILIAIGPEGILANQEGVCKSE